MKKPKKTTVLNVLCVVYAVISFALLVLALLIRFATDWSVAKFGNIPFGQILFTLQAPLTGSGSDIVNDFITGALKYILPVFIPTLLFYLLRFMPNKNLKLKLAGKEKSVNIFNNRLFKIMRAAIMAFVLILMTVNVAYAMDKLNINEYLKAVNTKTDIFETYYVDASDIEIAAPEEKKNLIYIFCESMETSFASKEYGGAWEET